MLIYKVMTLTATERDALYEFYQNRAGSYEQFWYFDFQNRKWIDQYVGQGSGTFDLPCILDTPIVTETIDGILTEAGDRIVTEDGDVITGVSLVGILPIIYFNGIPTTDYAYRIGTGEGGVDQIVSGAPNETLITIDFTGYLRIKGRFKDDKLTEELIESDPQNRFENLSVSVYEVKN